MTNFPHYGTQHHEFAPGNPPATRQLSLLLVAIPMALLGILIGAFLGGGVNSPQYATTSVTFFGVLLFGLLAWGLLNGYEDWYNDRLPMLSNTRQECRVTWIMCLMLAICLTLGYTFMAMSS